jgi:hypothetical protein
MGARNLRRGSLRNKSATYGRSLMSRQPVIVIAALLTSLLSRSSLALARAALRVRRAERAGW